MGAPAYIQGLKDAGGADITNMGANWTSKWYPFGKWDIFSLQLLWSNAAITGTLYLDISSGPDGDIPENKNTIVVDGSFGQYTFLDAQLAVLSYRLRFVHTAGAGTLSKVIHSHKRSGRGGL